MHILYFIGFFLLFLDIFILLFFYFMEQNVHTTTDGLFLVRYDPIVIFSVEFMFFVFIFGLGFAFFMLYFFFESKKALVFGIFFLGVGLLYFSIKYIDNIFYYFYPPLTVDDKIRIFNETLTFFNVSHNCNLFVRFEDIHPLIKDLNYEQDIIDVLRHYLNERLIIDKAGNFAATVTLSYMAIFVLCVIIIL